MKSSYHVAQLPLMSAVLQCQPAPESLQYTVSFQRSAHPHAFTLTDKTQHNTKTASDSEDDSYIIPLFPCRDCVVLPVWHLLLAPNKTSQSLYLSTLKLLFSGEIFPSRIRPFWSHKVKILVMRASPIMTSMYIVGTIEINV